MEKKYIVENNQVFEVSNQEQKRSVSSVELKQRLYGLREAFDAGDWYKFLIPAAEALGEWPMIELDADQVELVRHGHRIPAQPEDSGWARAVTQQGDLVALIEVVEGDQEWQPRKVFFQS